MRSGLSKNEWKSADVVKPAKLELALAAVRKDPNRSMREEEPRIRIPMGAMKRHIAISIFRAL